MDLSIRSVNTSKDDIEQPLYARSEQMYIAPLGSSVIISGKSGCGKSTLLANLLGDERFYKGWFDHVFLFSPTANGDDIQRSLDIPSNHVFTDLDEAPELLDMILNKQQEKLDSAESAADVAQYCIIFDDVIGNTKFMNDRSFLRCFYQVRHVNCTTFICTQYFKRIPRVCRLQANFIHFFEGSQSEVETVAEEFAPPELKKKAFKQLVADATCEDFEFLTINMKVPARVRFRRNLDGVIDMKNYGAINNYNGILDCNDNDRGKAQQDDDEELVEDPGERRKRNSARKGANGERYKEPHG